MDYRRDTDSMLENLGFINLTTQTVQIPLKRDPGDFWEKYLVETFLVALTNPHDKSHETSTLVGLSMQLFTTYLGWEPDKVRRLCNDVTAVLTGCALRKKLPIYFNL